MKIKCDFVKRVITDGFVATYKYFYLAQRAQKLTLDTIYKFDDDYWVLSYAPARLDDDVPVILTPLGIYKSDGSKI